MNQRDKLIELLQGSKDKYINLLDFEKRIIADYLLENNVVILPCNVGDSAYCIDLVMNKETKSFERKIIKHKIEMIQIQENLVLIHCNKLRMFSIEQFGKDVFKSKEEAEKALKEREKNDLRRCKENER